MQTETVLTTANAQAVEHSPVDSTVNASYMQQQIFLLEDTVMTMSMAVTTISKAIHRWERAIMPMALAFILLASYGFYLIYNLTYDIGMMSNNMAQMTLSVGKNMDIVADELGHVRHNMDQITAEVTTMKQEIVQIGQTMYTMNDSIGRMSEHTQRMGADLWDLNRNISGPMSTVNNWAPWGMMGGRKEPTPPMPPQPSYYTAPYPSTPAVTNGGK